LAGDFTGGGGLFTLSTGPAHPDGNAALVSPQGEHGAEQLAISNDAIPGYLGLSLTAWLKIAVLSVLLAATFRYSLVRLFLKTNPITGEANWGHSFCVPIIGLYYLYLNREDLLSAPVRAIPPGQFDRFQLISSATALLVGVIGCVVLRLAGVTGQLILLFGGIGLVGGLSLILNWGMGVLIFGLLVFAYGIYPGRNDFVTDVGDVITLFGLVLMLCGWRVMKVAWFPIAFLVCAIPWPGLVYSRVASPLQRLAANVAVGVMNLLGVDSNASGTKIFISSGIYGQPWHALNVAEACAGLRSLMTFISVAVAIAFLSIRPLWQRAIISLSAIPIAIFCNVMRVAGTGLLYRYGGSDWAEGFTHQFVGLVMLVPAFFMILMVGWVLDHLFVEEMEGASGKPARQVLRRAPTVLSAATNLPAANVADAAATRHIAREPNAPRRPMRRATDGGTL
jgi:exosortase